MIQWSGTAVEMIYFQSTAQATVTSCILMETSRTFFTDVQTDYIHTYEFDPTSTEWQTILLYSNTKKTLLDQSGMVQLITVFQR